jgi:hypothetical protein
LINELRAAKGEMQDACTSDPTGQRCRELTDGYNIVVQRYRMLLNESPVDCRGMLPDPLAI